MLCACSIAARPLSRADARPVSGASLSSAPSSTRERVAKHMERGSKLFTSGDTISAASEYQAAAALQPDRLSAQLNLAVSLHASGKLEEALAAYRLVSRLNPEHNQVYLNTGDVLRALRRPEEAVAAYTRGAALRPSAQAFLSLGSSLFESGRYDEASYQFKVAVSTDGDQYSDSAYNNLGLCADHLGDKPRAIEYFTAALRVNPVSADAYSNMGDSFGPDERPRAIRALQIAISLAPHHSGAYSNLANELRNDPVRSIELNKMSLMLNPTSAMVWYNQGTVLGEHNLFSSQLQHFKKARELWFQEFSSEYPSARAVLERHWSGTGVSLSDYRGEMAPGTQYGVSGAVARVGGWKQVGPHPGGGPYENLRFSEKRIRAATLERVELGGHAGVIRRGSAVFIGNQDLYIPMHDQRLRASSHQITVALDRAISVVYRALWRCVVRCEVQVSLSSANYFHFFCEVIPRLVISRQIWGTHTAPLIIRDREVNTPRDPLELWIPEPALAPSP